MQWYAMQYTMLYALHTEQKIVSFIHIMAEIETANDMIRQRFI